MKNLNKYEKESLYREIFCRYLLLCIGRRVSDKEFFESFINRLRNEREEYLADCEKRKRERLELSKEKELFNE